MPRSPGLPTKPASAWRPGATRTTPALWSDAAFRADLPGLASIRWCGLPARSAWTITTIMRLATLQRRVFAEQLGHGGRRRAAGGDPRPRGRCRRRRDAARSTRAPRSCCIRSPAVPVLRDAGLAHGWFFSFSGMVTFKSWTQLDTVRAVPADRLLIETDAPYLAPVPLRGKRNEPAFVVEVARASRRDSRSHHSRRSPQCTTGNAMRLFWARSASDSPST